LLKVNTILGTVYDEVSTFLIISFCIPPKIKKNLIIAVEKIKTHISNTLFPKNFLFVK